MDSRQDAPTAHHGPTTEPGAPVPYPVGRTLFDPPAGLIEQTPAEEILPLDEEPGSSEEGSPSPETDEKPDPIAS